MIEIPESHTLARQLTETICERKILKVLAGYSPHAFAWFTGHPKSYASLLEGTTITDARAIAGWVEITAGNVRLLLNDGVNVRFINKRVKTPRKTSAVYRIG